MRTIVRTRKTRYAVKKVATSRKVPQQEVLYMIKKNIKIRSSALGERTLLKFWPGLTRNDDMKTSEGFVAFNGCANIIGYSNRCTLSEELCYKGYRFFIFIPTENADININAYTNKMYIIWG